MSKEGELKRGAWLGLLLLSKEGESERGAGRASPPEVCIWKGLKGKR